MSCSIRHGSCAVRAVPRVLAGIILAGVLLDASDLSAAGLSQTQTVTNAAIPKRGGTLRLALPSDVSSLDPALAFDTISEPFLMLLYRGLVQYDDGVNVVPSLAADWNVSADLRTYTFHLRPHVRFSNGREVIASDFVFSLERLLNPKTSAPTESFFEGIAGAKDFRAGKASNVRGLRAPRSDTLEIELEEPDLSFLYILTIPGALVVPREAVQEFGKSFGSHPVGTGPYALTQWRRGVEMRFERNRCFFDPDSQYLDAVNVMVGGDDTLHLMMFERGELDIADVTEAPGIPGPDYLRLRHSARWRNLIDRLPASITAFLFMNTEMEPFDNPKVRQAMSYAINKDKLVLLSHDMIIPAKGLLPPMMPGFNPKLAGYPYDPAKARQLLAASGHAGGFACKLWFAAGTPILDQESSSIQYDLAQVGIKAELNSVSFAPLLDSMERRKTVQCGMIGASQDYPDPSDFLDYNFNGNRITEEGCQNFPFYNNPAFNSLLGQAARCTEPQTRLGIYQKAEQILLDDAPCVFLYHPYVYGLRQPWLHGMSLHPVLYFRFERMWMDR